MSVMIDGCGWRDVELREIAPRLLADRPRIVVVAVDDGHFAQQPARPIHGGIGLGHGGGDERRGQREQREHDQRLGHGAIIAAATRRTRIAGARRGPPAIMLSPWKRDAPCAAAIPGWENCWSPAAPSRWNSSRARCSARRPQALPLGQLLVKLGYVTDEAMRMALASQLGIPFIDLDKTIIDRNLARTVGRTFAYRHLLVPIAQSGRTLTIAMDDPTKKSAGGRHFPAQRHDRHGGHLVEPGHPARAPPVVRRRGRRRHGRHGARRFRAGFGG